MIPILSKDNNMTRKMPNNHELIFQHIVNNLIGPQINRESITEIIKNLQVIYNQPDRHYHNFKHILNVTDFIDENLEHFNNPRIALWATLYHDIVYDTHSKYNQNEDESAKFAVRQLSGKLSNEELDHISNYINATANHYVKPGNTDLCLFLDADMSILGSSRKTYNEYAANIRKEYDWVPNKQYSNARAKVLLDFLDRDKIFITDIGKGMFEKKARENIKCELEGLIQIK